LGTWEHADKDDLGLSVLDEHDAEGAVSVGHGGEGERSAIDGDIALGNEIGEKISLLELEDDAEGVAVGDVALDDCGSIDMALGARVDTGCTQTGHNLPGQNGRQSEHGRPLHAPDSRRPQPCASLWSCQPAAPRQSTNCTKPSPLQGLVCQPDLEPAALFLAIKASHCQAHTVHRDRVANVAVVENRCCPSDGERATALVDDDGGNTTNMFYQASEHGLNK